MVVAAMHKDMHEWTGQDQKVRCETQEIGRVAGVDKKAEHSDGGKGRDAGARTQPVPKAAVACGPLFMLMLERHRAISSHLV